MGVRTFLSILTAVVAVVVASYLTHHNAELFGRPFEITEQLSVPTWAALVGIFLAGLLPAGLVHLLQTLRRDLRNRRARRLEREKKSQRGSFRRAVDLQADRQWSAAAEEFERLIAERPEEFETLLRYGESLRHLGRLDAALEVHQRAAVLYPQSTAVLHQMAEDYDALDQPEVAQQIRDRILRDFPDRGLKLLRRRRARAMGESDWREATLLQDRIDALVGSGGGAKDVEREHAVRLGLTYQRALQRMADDQPVEARKILRELLKEAPDFLPATILLGEAERLTGNDGAALEVWTSAFGRLGDPVLLQRIEDHFIERAEPGEAIHTLHGLIASSENDLLPRFFLGRLYYRLEMHDEALEVLPELADRIETSPTYHLLLARIHHRRGRMEAAAESYLACVREIGLAAEYRCRTCTARYDAWSDRCSDCGSWNSVELDFEEEKLSAEALGVHRGPVWTISDVGSDDLDSDRVSPELEADRVGRGGQGEDGPDEPNEKPQ